MKNKEKKEHIKYKRTFTYKLEIPYEKTLRNLCLLPEVENSGRPRYKYNVPETMY